MSLQPRNNTGSTANEEEKNKENEEKSLSAKVNQIKPYEPHEICSITVPKSLVHTASFYAELRDGSDSKDVSSPTPTIQQAEEDLGEPIFSNNDQ